MLQARRKYVKLKNPPKYREKNGKKQLSTKGRIRKIRKKERDREHYDKKSLQGGY